MSKNDATPWFVSVIFLVGGLALMRGLMGAGACHPQLHTDEHGPCVQRFDLVAPDEYRRCGTKP